MSFLGLLAVQVKNGLSDVSPSFATTIDTGTSSELGTSGASARSVINLNYDAVASVLRSFDDHRSKTTSTLSVNTADLSGENKRISKFAQKQKMCWDFGGPNHLRGDDKCSEKRESRAHRTEAKPISKSEDIKLTKPVTFNIFCSHEVGKVNGRSLMTELRTVILECKSLLY